MGVKSGMVKDLVLGIFGLGLTIPIVVAESVVGINNMARRIKIITL